MEGGNFIDYVKVFCHSGNGGSGSMHFRREKFIPRGGPDGGDGGRGGDVIIRCKSNLWTLLHLRFTKHALAENGEGGSGAQRTGADGKSVYLDVPIGTVVKDAETHEVLCEVTRDGEEVVLFKGGRGGMGNTFFKTATNQAPKFSQTGEEGTEKWVILELKVLADVGLVGFPNAGKSTLLSVVSAARPKIADYPFTTLTPNLGVVSYHDSQSFVMADIPGIIEGAAEGKGLGLRFLRHIERNSVLLFVIPANTENINSEYKILLGELKKYNPELTHKPRIIGISKIDLLTEEELAAIKKTKPRGIKTVFFSSATQTNLDKLKELIWKTINEDE